MARRQIVRRGPHRPGCQHCARVRLLGRDYWTWRASWEIRCEAASIGYATEEREYRDEHPAPTFKSYLVSMAGSGWPMSGQQPRRRFAA